MEEPVSQICIRLHELEPCLSVPQFEGELGSQGLFCRGELRGVRDIGDMILSGFIVKSVKI